jgi:hypothetical protein
MRKPTIYANDPTVVRRSRFAQLYARDVVRAAAVILGFIFFGLLCRQGFLLDRCEQPAYARVEVRR